MSILSAIKSAVSLESAMDVYMAHRMEIRDLPIEESRPIFQAIEERQGAESAPIVPLVTFDPHGQVRVSQ